MRDVLAVSGALFLKRSTISGYLVVLDGTLLCVLTNNLVCLGFRAFMSHNWQSALTNWFFKLSGFCLLTLVSCYGG